MITLWHCRGFATSQRFEVTTFLRILTEILSCIRETTNRFDPFAVAVKKDSIVVGHVPRKIPAICSLFLRRRGIISCQIVGVRRYSSDLPQGGLEVPCKLIFEGNGGDIRKVSILLVNCKEDDKKAKGPMSTTAEEAQAINADKKGNDLESDQLVAKRRKAEAQTEDIVEEWVLIGKISLKNSDQKILLQGDELNDLHINACQVLLAKQFRSLMGLKSTLVKHHIGQHCTNPSCPNKKPLDYIQHH